MTPSAPAGQAPDSRLSDDQIADFDRDGYLVLRNWIPAGLIADLQAATAGWMEQGRRLGSNVEDATSELSDFRFAHRDGHEVLFRVDYIHGKGSPVSLQLLGCPQVLAIASSLAGPDFVPTYESLVFKEAGDGAPIEWHQDAVHPRRYRIFNVDIYLDASRSGAGALRVVPGSQRQGADICALESAYGWAVPGAIEVEMEPGDVLVHDTMVVHGSPAATGNALRRTIYYEFRPAEQILAEGPWDRSWVDARLRLVPLGLAACAARSDATEPFDWQISSDLRPDPLSDTEAELRVVHQVHTPGAYCSAGAVG
jgi:ectoine hydroxylase-related dioxygenase (phytanoyl-CoA dioxygenase family)